MKVALRKDGNGRLGFEIPCFGFSTHVYRSCQRSHLKRSTLTTCLKYREHPVDAKHSSRNYIDPVAQCYCCYCCHFTGTESLEQDRQKWAEQTKHTPSEAAMAYLAQHELMLAIFWTIALRPASLWRCCIYVLRWHESVSPTTFQEAQTPGNSYWLKGLGV